MQIGHEGEVSRSERKHNDHRLFPPQKPATGRPPSQWCGPCPPNPHRRQSPPAATAYATERREAVAAARSTSPANDA